MTMYTNQQLDDAREELIAAFVGFLPRHENQYESHGIYAVCNEARILKLAVYAALGLELGEKKISNSNTTHIMRSKQRAHSHSHPLVNDQVFKQCSLIRSLDRLNPIAKAWVSAAYLDQNRYQLIKLTHDIYKTKFKIRKGSERNVEILILMAVISSISESLDRKSINDVDIAKEMQITKTAFCNNWKSKLTFIKELLFKIDEQCLSMICFELEYPTYSPSLKQSKFNRTKLIY